MKIYKITQNIPLSVWIGNELSKFSFRDTFLSPTQFKMLKTWVKENNIDLNKYNLIQAIKEATYFDMKKTPIDYLTKDDINGIENKNQMAEMLSFNYSLTTLQQIIIDPNTIKITDVREPPEPINKLPVPNAANYFLITIEYENPQSQLSNYAQFITKDGETFILKRISKTPFIL